MAQALRHDDGQLALYRASAASARLRRAARQVESAPVCAGCRTREARYGFQDGTRSPEALRPRTLCFDCFRMELTWRQDVVERLSRGWAGRQAELPLQDTLDALAKRRRRAQIAARKALGER